MIFDDFFKAVRQLPDPGFQRVLWTGIGLTIALLAGVTGFFLWLMPNEISIFGWSVPYLSDLLDGLTVAAMVGLSVCLMVPVASLFSSFFLEGVAAAVERRHYPNLPPAAGTSFVDNLREGISFLGLIIIVNILALVVYVLFNVAAPLVFWVVNGILLGREYFFLVAMRRVGRSQAKDLRARHSLEVWAAGVLMAVPLTVPVVNILVPILGAATFTHLYHRLADH